METHHFRFDILKLKDVDLEMLLSGVCPQNWLKGLLDGSSRTIG